MVERTEMRPVKVRYCDYCGAEASGLYSTCDYCKKDICQKHHVITTEEESICRECNDKRRYR